MLRLFVLRDWSWRGAKERRLLHSKTLRWRATVERAWWGHHVAWRLELGVTSIVVGVVTHHWRRLHHASAWIILIHWRHHAMHGVRILLSVHA